MLVNLTPAEGDIMGGGQFMYLSWGTQNKQ